jgi:glycyl-tRNA synthetase beta chain
MGELLIAVRCEELPYDLIAPALDGLVRGTRALLEGIEHGELTVYSTPRRLAVRVDDCAVGRPKVEKLVTGPSIQAPEGARRGFARGKGVAFEDLEVVEGKKGQVVGARVSEGGEQTVDLVAAGLEKLILGLPFKKSMQWGNGGVRWGRPIHQVMALFDGASIDASVAGIGTSTELVGHRLADGSATVSCAADYVSGLEGLWVLVDRDARKDRIRAQLLAAATEHEVNLELDEDLLDEVTDLVEWPVTIVGRFNEELLELPAKLLIESMKVHQRYFAALKADGSLDNAFFIVSNNPVGDGPLIAEGNRRVIAARFQDARFFLSEDRKKSLAEHGADLAKMRWVRKLGTMEEKQARLVDLAGVLAERLGHDADKARAAAALCKCDLLSQMVGEFPKLQGHMGHLYALTDGHDAEVASAIEEHYLPRYAGDDVPSTGAGQALALADRLDTLAGCFSIGLKPKGNDPQGLRRAANGVLAVLLAHGHRVSLKELVALPAFEAKGLVAFVLARFRALKQSEGHATDVIDAVLAAGGDDVVQLSARVSALSELSAGGDFGALMVAFKRILNISKEHDSTAFNAALFEHQSERDLASALAEAQTVVPGQVEALHVGDALAHLIQMKPTIDQYFDDVLVNCEDVELRASRLGLLCAISGLFRSIADFRAISAERS